MRDRGGIISKGDATGRMVMIWYGGFLGAGLLVWIALCASDSATVAAAALAGAVVTLLSLVSYTQRRREDEFRRHSLVAAVGPLAVAVMLFEYQVYQHRVEDTLSANLIDAGEVEVRDLDWSGTLHARGLGRLHGVVRNHSTIPLLGLSLELSVFSKHFQPDVVTADVAVAVPPGGEQSFDAAAPTAPLIGTHRLRCLNRNLDDGRNDVLAPVKCRYQVSKTRAVLDF
jgi:membrane protein implicated in regulation of membrane protease activity